MLKRSFALLELVIVVIIIGILLTLAIPKITITRERSLGQEAFTSLQFIFEAERMYLRENGTYYPNSGGNTESDIADINKDLRLSFSETDWDYYITNPPPRDTFCAYAARNGSGGFLNCVYQICNGDADPSVMTSPCAYP